MALRLGRLQQRLRPVRAARGLDADRDAVAVAAAGWNLRGDDTGSESRWRGRGDREYLPEPKSRRTLDARRRGACRADASTAAERLRGGASLDHQRGNDKLHR